MGVVHPVPAVGGGKKSYHTRRAAGQSPVIDGHFEEPAWQCVPWIGDFIQKSPYEGAAPSQKTMFKIIYDNRNLYIAIRALDTEPDRIVSRMTRRDENDGDWLEIGLDTYLDHRTGFMFAVNAAGVKTDAVLSGDGENRDDSWDPVWYVKTSRDNHGWSAEMRIPLAQLRFGRKKEHTWGFYAARFLHRKQETSEWQLIPQKAEGLVSLFGELKGLSNIYPRRMVELLPYTVVNTQRFQPEEGNPFATGKSSGVDIGLDGKLGLNNDFTLDFTINPDFGQVEADPSEVNLTTFETFFEEKRPFFIEGRNILDYLVSGGSGPYAFDNLFYSRRIGRSPQYVPDAADGHYMDMPTNTTILAAFKLTGKTHNGLSVGILESITQEEKAEIYEDGKLREEAVEPLTNYFVLRLHKDSNKGNTGIGGIFTAVNRNTKDLPGLHLLHRSAYTAGLDFFHYWNNKDWMVSLKSVFSYVEGSPEALDKTQRSSRRYFQRPDAHYLNYDPNRTTLTGNGGDLSFGKIGGKLQLLAGAVWRSPGLELNDAGYLRAADKIMVWSAVGYRITQPFSIFRNFMVNLNVYNEWNYGGETVFSGAILTTSLEFKNYWSFNGGGEWQRPAIYNEALRGGPSLAIPGGWNYFGTLYSDTRKSIYFWLGSALLHHRHRHTRFISVWGGVTCKPFDALSLTVEPAYTSNKRNLQYVNTIDWLENDRYVFGRLNQKILDLTVRLNYSITPDLSVQFYGQPFISTARYDRFKHITDPRAAVYENRYHEYSAGEITYNTGGSYYSIDEKAGPAYLLHNPNFNFLQFRSNLVVRWEYTPGSTLFLVWSQGRTDTQMDDLSFSTKNNLRDLFQVPPHDVFLLKFTYRFKL